MMEFWFRIETVVVFFEKKKYRIIHLVQGKLFDLFLAVVTVQQYSDQLVDGGTFRDQQTLVLRLEKIHSKDIRISF